MSPGKRSDFVKSPDGAFEHLFRKSAEEAYELAVTEAEEPFVRISIDRMRRESGSLVGEVQIWCAIAGAATFDGILSVADLNLSSQRARTERATYLATRAKSPEVDWRGLLDEFAVRVLAAERVGSPSVDLGTVERPQKEQGFEHAGVVVPRAHPSILFGDGGTAKSYFALWFLGRLAISGTKVALFDWELEAPDHRERLELIFGQRMPSIQYARCDRPLVYETDRLKRICKDHQIEYACYDSIGAACDGAPESAEQANKYMRAVRQIGVGSLHIAHVSKQEGADQKPFGSVFWHNGARSTWYAKIAEQGPNGTIRQVGFFNRKSNLSALKPPVAIEMTFGEEYWAARRVSMEDVPELSTSLSLNHRITLTLKKGAMIRSELMAEFDDQKRDSVKNAINRAIKRGRLIRFRANEQEMIGLAESSNH